MEKWNMTWKLCCVVILGFGVWGCSGLFFGKFRVSRFEGSRVYGLWGQGLGGTFRAPVCRICSYTNPRP